METKTYRNKYTESKRRGNEENQPKKKSRKTAVDSPRLPVKRKRNISETTETPDYDLRPKRKLISYKEDNLDFFCAKSFSKKDKEDESTGKVSDGAVCEEVGLEFLVDEESSTYSSEKSFSKKDIDESEKVSDEAVCDKVDLEFLVVEELSAPSCSEKSVSKEDTEDVDVKESNAEIVSDAAVRDEDDLEFLVHEKSSVSFFGESFSKNDIEYEDKESNSNSMSEGVVLDLEPIDLTVRVTSDDSSDMVPKDLTICVNSDEHSEMGPIDLTLPIKSDESCDMGAINYYEPEKKPVMIFSRYKAPWFRKEMAKRWNENLSNFLSTAGIC